MLGDKGGVSAFIKQVVCRAKCIFYGLGLLDSTYKTAAIRGVREEAVPSFEDAAEC